MVDVGETVGNVHQVVRKLPVALLCVALSSMTVLPAHAQTTEDTVVADPLGGSGGLEYIDAPVTGRALSDGYGNVSVAQAEVEGAREAVRVTSAGVADAEVVLAEATSERTRQQLDLTSQQRALDGRRDVSEEATGVLIDARGRVDALAANAYVAGGIRPGRLETILASSDPVEAGRRQVLLVAAGDDQVEQVNELLTLRAAADDDVVVAVDNLTAAQGRLRQAELNVEIAEANRDAAVDAAVVAETKLAAATEQLGAARTTLLALAPSATLDNVDIPILAVDAYVRAADWAKRSFAGCDIEWYVIAGIARQETNHGRYGGSRVTATGEVFPHIIGIALDGTRSLAIADTDGGLLDGDAVWDRAVGPTQFIPTTWRSYAARFDLDGNRDGRVDPHNIYDQTRATATLLCRNGWRESDPAAQLRAVYSYNPSNSYVTKVMNWISGYRTVALPDLNLVSPVLTQAPIAPPPQPPNFNTTTTTMPGTDVTTPPTTIDPPVRPVYEEPTVTTTLAPAPPPATTPPPAPTTPAVVTTAPPTTPPVTTPPTTTSTTTTVAPPTTVPPVAVPTTVKQVPTTTSP